MSIFPRKVCNGEYVIFHMGFKGILDKHKNISYCLELFNPNNELVLELKNNLLIRGNNKLYEKDLYYPILIDDSFIPGKYVVNFYLIDDGKIIKSSTKDNDIFLVEKVNCFIENLNNKKIIVLENKSSEEVTLELYLEGKRRTKKEITLLPYMKKEIETKSLYAYIEYGNNDFKIIS